MQPEPRPKRHYWVVAIVVLAVLVGLGIYTFMLLKPEFEVSLDYPSTLTQGQTGELKVMVKNKGDRAGSYELEVGIGDNVWRVKVWVPAGSENVLKYPIVATAVGPLKVRAGDKVGQVWVNPALPPSLPGGMMTMAGTVGTPVSWQLLENLSGSGKAPEK